LAEPSPCLNPRSQKHLKVLERAGLIARDRDAQRRPSRLVAKPLAEGERMAAPLSPVLEFSFQSLDDLLEDLTVAKKRTLRKKTKRPTSRKL